MSSLGNLPDNKIVSLAMHGVDPFMPENGAFCGGYQGLLYPNPTTLVYPEFDPYQYTVAEASVFMPNTSFIGLGAGNPGIDYKNPGHIIGLLDTFCRMSYGIGMLEAIHIGDDSVGTPPVNVRVPMLSWNGSVSFGASDIYPLLSEIPTDWVSSFRIRPDGSMRPEIPTDAHTPDLNMIDTTIFNNLFFEKLILSYYGMPQYFRSVIESLYNSSSALIDKSELTFILDDPDIYNQYGEMPSDASDFPSINLLDNSNWEQGGKVIHQCEVLSPSQALKVLTGSESYHDGSDGLNEYRSLTELNSVVNIVPLRTTGSTYWFDCQWPREEYTEAAGAVIVVDEWSGRGFKTAAKMYSDFLIHVSDIPDDLNNPQPTTVTVTGEVKIKNLIKNVGVYNWHLTKRYGSVPLSEDDWQEDITPDEITFGPEEWMYKKAEVSLEVANKYSWDRSWLDKSSISESEDFEDTFSDITIGGIAGGPDGDGGLTPFASDHEVVVPFSKTFTLAPGCNTIKMRIKACNRHWIRQKAEAYIIHEDAWWPYGTYWWKWWGELLGYDPWMYVYPRAVLYSLWENDPSTARDVLEWSSIEASFTVAGNKFGSMEYEVSL